MKKLTTLTLMAALLGSATTTVLAHDHEHSHAHQHSHDKVAKKGEQLPRDLRALNLNTEQKNKIQTILNQLHQRPAQPSATERQALEQKINQRQAAEQQLISAKTFNESEARRLINERRQDRAEFERRQDEMQLKNLKARHEIFQVLTPEQQQQWLNQRKNRRLK